MIESFNNHTVIWEPTDRQKVALACPAFEVLFGGAKGGGKSAWLVAAFVPLLQLAHRKFLETGREQSNCRIAIFRKNLHDLKDIIVKQRALYPLVDPEMGIDGYKDKEKFWRFTSGATVEMHHLDDPLSHLAFNGHEFAGLGIDEAQFISWEAYSFLLAQVRSSDPDYARERVVRLTANPGGPYGDWVKKRYVDPYPAGGKIISDFVKLPDGRTVEMTRAFVRSFIADNKHIDPTGEYQAQMRATMSPEEIRQYLEGDFDVVSGAFFSHLLQPNHFQRSRSIPSTWDMLFSIDWGSTSPACCLIAAQDPSTNCLYIIDELHEPGVTGQNFGQRMKRKLWGEQKWSNQHVWRPGDFYGVIDTQAMDKHNGPGTAATGIQEEGFRIFPAQKNPGERPTGINQIKQRLLVDRHGNVQIIIFEDRCPHLARALRSILADPLDIDDYYMKSPQAHAIDALRFICMQWTLQPPTPINHQDQAVTNWNEMLKRAKEKALAMMPPNTKVTGGY